MNIKEANISVIGQGYVGLPLAIEFGKKRSIVGFDIGSVIISAVQEKILIKGGGHKMAGGFTIKTENVEKFKKFTLKKFERLSNNKMNIY